jgi:hypothetical protein
MTGQKISIRKILIQYNNNQTLRKCWQIDDSMGKQANVYSQNRMILLHIKGTSGFLPWEKLKYQTGCSIGIIMATKTVPSLQWQ